MLIRLISLVVLLLLVPSTQAEIPGLVVPEGFQITEFADSRLANDIHCMTVNPGGQVVVSGRGYIRLLLDEQKSGKAMRAVDFRDAPRDGAMGLCWDGDDLYCVGDGGIRCYRQAAGDGKNRPPQLLVPLTTGGEHAAHAMGRGPDGWFYLLCGDHTGINRARATLPTSPIQDPVGGCLLRFPPEALTQPGKSNQTLPCEIVADGFRNAYGMDWNRQGDFFTFDSDNERCIGLPWYEPTRVYQIIPGGHHGWLAPRHAATWRMPPYYLDVVPPRVTLGRGSPTGVVCYKGQQFPEHYQNGLFLLDWTFGRIWFVPRGTDGGRIEGEPELFLKTVGENGFAPTAAAVDPTTGDLYVSIGGRGTRGAVYRIRHQAKGPLASIPAAQLSLQLQPEQIPELLQQARQSDRMQRLRALLRIERHAAMLRPQERVEIVAANLDESDRLIRQSVARLIRTLSDEDRRQLRQKHPSVSARLTFALSQPGDLLLDVIRDAKLPEATRLDAVRLLQLALGDVGSIRVEGGAWEGYTLRNPTAKLDASSREAIRSLVPTRHRFLDLELSRILALIEDEADDLPRRLAAFLTEDSEPMDDLHYLITLARVHGSASPALITSLANGLLRLDEKLERRGIRVESNWSARLGEILRQLARQYPGLTTALIEHPAFGRPEHAIFAQQPGVNRSRAAQRFWLASQKEESAGRNYAWNARIVSLLIDLPDGKGPSVLRSLWGKAGQDETILSLLARSPRGEDRSHLIAGLASGRLQTVQIAAEGLNQLPASRDRDELLAMVLALGRLPSGKDGDGPRKSLLDLLRKSSGHNESDGEGWSRWLKTTWPEIASRLQDRDGVDVAAWEKRLEKVAWDRGDANRGQMVFRKASCAACHGGSQAIGPELEGVAGRFSRDDLLTAILRPSKDVSPRYRTTLLTTSTGKTYQGLIIYEANDGVLLQAGPDSTIRLANTQIAERQVTAMSLMPAGLLDRLSNEEIADLLAYLKGLSRAPTARGR